VETVAAVIRAHGWGSMVDRVAFDEGRIGTPA
jgi:hypothetical protein